jgi:hypothetical protein
MMRLAAAVVVVPPEQDGHNHVHKGRCMRMQEGATALKSPSVSFSDSDALQANDPQKGCLPRRRDPDIHRGRDTNAASSDSVESSDTDDDERCYHHDVSRMVLFVLVDVVANYQNA